MNRKLTPVALRIATPTEIGDLYGMRSPDEKTRRFDAFTAEQFIQAAERLQRLAGFVRREDLSERLLRLAQDYRRKAKGDDPTESV